MPGRYYLDKLYPFQDEILNVVEKLGLDFYLTGGAALSRCYLQHRYSDDLDFFVNDHQRFKEQSRQAIDALKRHWHCDIASTSGTFVRIFVHQSKLTLKIDFVNDVPYHFGEIQRFPIFYRVDSWRNILSNKLCALSRLEAKDIADIIIISKTFPFDWETVMGEAREKDLWVDPLAICQIVKQLPINRFNTVKWTSGVNVEELRTELDIIHDDVFNGALNSLFEA